MKKTFSSITTTTILCLLFSQMTFATDQDPIPVKVKKINNDVAIFSIEAKQATNVIVVNTKDGLVVIDTEVSPVFTQSIYQNIKTFFGNIPVKYLINTHSHPDHTFGNQVFKDAIVVGHEKCKEDMVAQKEAPARLAKRMQLLLTRLQNQLKNLDKDSEQATQLKKTIQYYDQMAAGLSENFQLTYPDITFSDQSSISIGEYTFHLFHFGYSHSDNDVVIYCPEAELLATGDIFYQNNDPYVDSDRIASLPQMIKVCKTIQSNADKIKQIVPGHAEMISMEVIDDFCAKLEAFGEQFAGRESAFKKVTEIYQSEGCSKSIDCFNTLWNQKDEYYFIHSEFDSFIYKLMLEDKLDDALILFELMTQRFPEVSMAWDSLGEVLLRKGEKEKALKAFEKSLKLDPSNTNASNRIKELKK